MASEPSDATSLTPGQTVGGGRYSLVRELGRGGMGVVWQAHDERLEERVALKFLPTQIRSDPAALDDLRRETKKSRKLTHPNIIRIHDFFEAKDEAPFISMEFVDGPNLSALRVDQPNGIFTWDFLGPLTRQLCDALEYAHQEKVIHRDLKPANMMLDGKGRLKLADFGIAAVVSDSISRVSLHHTTSGTLTHMSPQQLDGQSPRVTDDIYSLGATLYELLTGKPPFYTGDVPHQVRTLPAQPLQDRLEETETTNPIPPAVAAMILACLSKDPMRRPQSARAVAEWIGLTQADGPGPRSASLAASTLPAALVPSSPTFARLTGLPKRFWWGAGIAALFALAGGGWFWATHLPAKKTTTNLLAAVSTDAKSGRLVFEEKFENLDAQGKPKLWEWSVENAGIGAKGSMKEINGNHFLQMEATGTNGVVRTGLEPEHALALEKSWKALRISFRVKTRNLKINPFEFSGAHLSEAWMDDKTNYFRWDGSVPIREDKDWIVIEDVQSIPVQATRVQFVFHLTKASGIMAFDDLRVSAIEGKREENVQPEEGFISLFNGRDLSGWEFEDESHRKFWSVKDGAIVCDSNTGFSRIFWEGTVDDFELRFSYKLGHLISPENGGCGPQYRLQFTATNVTGYGMSLGFGGNFLLSGGRRGTLALLGQKAVAKNVNGRDALEVAGFVGNAGELGAIARDADWNDAVITVRGHQHFCQLNGRTTIDFTDENVAQRTSSGSLSLSLWNKERPFTGVQYKNIRLKRL